MKKWNSRFLTGYQDCLLLCFLGGAVGGTIAANLMSGELQSQIGCFAPWIFGEQIMDKVQKMQMYQYVLKQRTVEFFMVWFLTLTVVSKPGFYCLGGWLGAVSALTISILTGQFGMLGLAVYVVVIAPQCFLYLPVVLVLAEWARKEEKKVRPLGVTVLFAAVAVGAAAEVYVNPYLQRFLMRL